MGLLVRPDGAPTVQVKASLVVIANRTLIRVSDGIAKKERHPEAGGMIERERQ